MNWNTYIIMTLIMVVSCIAVSRVQFENGRMDMCKDEGKYYTYEDGCQTCEETGRIMYNGKCVIEETWMNIEGKYKW